MTNAKNPAPPAGNAAEDNSLAGVLRFFMTKMQQQTDDMLPAVVISYSRATNRAKVQPLIAFVTTAGEVLPRATVGSVPVYQMGAGGFVLSFPVKKGDLGWIKANDRDLSTFKQSLNPAAPPTQRKKSFEDAMFFPDTMFKGVTISGEDSENVVLQTLDGTVRIALFDDKVKITAPEIVLDTPLTTVTGEIQAGTNPAYGNTASFRGNITTTHDVIAQTVSLHNHTHNGVQPGGGNTGGPNT